MNDSFAQLSLSQRQSVRKAVNGDNLYRMVYQPLWRQQGGDLRPEEVWSEAVAVADGLRDVLAVDAPQRAAETFDDLNERYGSFYHEHSGTQKRNQQEARHSSMMVITVSFFILLNKTERLEDNPNRFICKALKDLVRDIPGFNELYEGARTEEDGMERASIFIRACEIWEHYVALDRYEAEDCRRMHEVVSLVADETKKSSLPTLKEQERIFSRVNDTTQGAIASELEDLRQEINKRELGEGEKKSLSDEAIAAAVLEVQHKFWGQSAWAVIYCVCRDYFDGGDNVSQFERRIQSLNNKYHFDKNCPNGTIQKTISNNAFMKMRVDRWNIDNSKERSINLANDFKNVLNDKN